MGESCAANRNLGVISIEMAYETMGLVGVTKGMSVHREEDPGLTPGPFSISSQGDEEG